MVKTLKVVYDSTLISMLQIVIAHFFVETVIRILNKKVITNDINVLILVFVRTNVTIVIRHLHFVGIWNSIDVFILIFVNTNATILISHFHNVDLHKLIDLRNIDVYRAFQGPKRTPRQEDFFRCSGYLQKWLSDTRTTMIGFI